MENEPPHTQQATGHEEIIVLLRSLRIEATPEAYFEDRFIYEFRERLVSSAACRPARSLLWEHLLQIISNLGGRRLAWGLSSFGLGALCMGTLFWQHGGSKRALVTEICDLSEETALHPNAAQNLTSIRVNQRNKRRSHVDPVTTMRFNAQPYLAGLDDESSAQYFSTSLADDDDAGIFLPGLSPYWSY